MNLQSFTALYIDPAATTILISLIPLLLIFIVGGILLVIGIAKNILGLKIAGGCILGVLAVLALFIFLIMSNIS